MCDGNSSSTLGDSLNISNFHCARAKLRNGSYAIGPFTCFSAVILGGGVKYD